jgi:two-component system CheB/CheR fusion protein
MLLLEQTAALAVPPPLQIFASDLDEDALTYARDGRYPEPIAADVSEARVQRFFVREGAYYRVKPELRERILFTTHNLLKDPPFSRLDLISCRNLLIYLQRELQEKVIELFHYALTPAGYLFLGSAESLTNPRGLFRTVDATHHLYRRVPAAAPGPVLLPDLPLVLPTPRGKPLSRPRPGSTLPAVAEAELHRQALEAAAPPSLLVDAEATIVHVSETANRYLHFPSGVPSANLYRTVLPALRLALRPALSRALEQAEGTLTAPVPVDLQGQRRLVQLYVTPATRAPGPPQALVVFLEAPLPASGIPAAAGDADPQLRHLEEELDATKAQLRATIEGAETQQEELKAANEELQSVNEEYKSTLEELETSKEELQSINEELKTVNQELQARLQELSQSNNDFQNLMAATDVATLFVDRQLRIKLYTPPLTKIFNIMPVDQGRPLAHVTHRLRDGDLLRDTQQVLDTLVPLEREVQRDDGHVYLLRLAPYRTREDHIDGIVLTLVDITARKQAELALQQAHADLEARVDARTAELAAALEALRREGAEREQVEAERARLQEAARRAEHFAQLGRLAAGVAHEIRNPLASIFLQVDLLLEELAPLSPELQAQLLPIPQQIQGDLARLEDIVENYLALVRVGALQGETVDLGAVIQDVARECEPSLAARGVPLRLEGLSELGAVVLHANTFRRVLLNLVHNALDAMPQGGTLTFRGRQTAARVQLDIRDTGVGIPAEQLPRIFEPLHTTKPGGTGFGLYLVREAMAAYGGTITVESVVGYGTTFTLTLPRPSTEDTHQG